MNYLTPPNPRLQRTRPRAPLSRKPLGAEGKHPGAPMSPHSIDAFHAGRIVADVIDGCWFVGFADREFNTVRYLSLSRTQQASEEDARLGMDTYYVERDDQQHSCYGGIASALLEPERLSISFTEEGSGNLSLSQLIVTFASASRPPDFEVSLGHVFSGTRCLVIAERGA